MSAPPYMPVFIADYTADVQSLSCEQDGAYWRLLRAMWRAGGVLPNTPRKLALICGLTEARWAKISDDVLELFIIVGDDLTHGRLAVELEKASELSQKKSDAGKQGAIAKALKNKKAPQAGASAQRKHARAGLLNLNLDSSEGDIESPSELRAGDVTIIDLFDDFPPSAFEVWYGGYPHKVGKDAAAKSFASVRQAKRATFAELNAGLAAYIATKPPDRSWCNPATWLNQGRWKDQPAIGDPNARPNGSPGFGAGPSGRYGSAPASFADIVAKRRGYAGDD